MICHELIMRAIPYRQSIEEALELWNQAEQQNLDIVSDDHGTLELLYSSVSANAPEFAAELKHKAMLNLIGKIRSELSSWIAATGGESAEVLLKHMPGLGQFAASGKLGNLRNEWTTLKQHRDSLASDIAVKRRNIFAEFSDLLPPMPTRFDANGTAILHQDFTAPAHQVLLDNEVQEVNKYALGDDGFYRTFITDLPRTFWDIEVDGKIISFGLMHAEEKLDALKKLFGNDMKALATASKLMNQAAAAISLGVNMMVSPIRSLVVMQSDVRNNKSTYFRITKIGEDIEFELNTYGKIDRVSVPPTLEDSKGKYWRVNQSSSSAGEPGPRNYAEHYRLHLLIDMQAASRGHLQPVPGTKIDGEAEYRFCPQVSSTISANAI